MTSEGIEGVKVGDDLILVTSNRYHDDEPVTVSRIGRKFLYVTVQGRERQERFNRATGVEDGQRGVPHRLYTQEQYDEMRQRTSLLAILREEGIDIRRELLPQMSTGKLRALLDVAAKKE